MPSNPEMDCNSFALYRGKQPSDLPTTPEGAIDVVKSPPVDGVKVLAPGVYKTTLKEIRGADYVLACNLVTAGKAHFAEGLAMSIRVRRSDFDILFDTEDEE